MVSRIGTSSLVRLMKSGIPGQQLSFPTTSISGGAHRLSKLLPVHESALPHLDDRCAARIIQGLEKLLEKKNLLIPQEVQGILEAENLKDLRVWEVDVNIPEHPMLKAPILAASKIDMSKPSSLRVLMDENLTTVSNKIIPPPAKVSALEGRFRLETPVQGIGVSKGIVIGRVLLHEREEIIIEKRLIEDNEIEKENNRFKKALSMVMQNLNMEIDYLKTTTSESYTEALEGEIIPIIEAHIQILKDPGIISKVKEKIVKSKVDAVWAVKETIDEQVKSFEELKDPEFKKLAMDIRDLGQQVIRQLLGKEIKPEHKEEGVIIVASDLLPSETIQFNRRKIIAIATGKGGPRDHVAVIARGLGIPAVVNLKNITQLVKTGDKIIADGIKGKVIVNPGEQTLSDYEIAKKKYENLVEKLIKEIEGKPCQTLDGVKISLLGNVESPEDISTLLAYGAKGVGLYRTEYDFLKRGVPAMEELEKIYEEIANHVYPGGVTFRTLDLGGDKSHPELGIEPEPNYWMGQRGIRHSMVRPDIFEAQIEALLRASATKKNIQILIPMITRMNEVKWAKEKIEKVKDRLRSQGINFDEKIKMGIMIETPAAVTLSPHLAKIVDFFSVGSNDLTQYTLAADRENPKVSDIYEPLDSVIVSALSHITKSAKKAGIEVCLCGELASDPEALPLLLGLGITPSVVVGALPQIKYLIRNLNLRDCQKLAQEILELIHQGKIFSGEEIRSAIREKLSFEVLQKLESIKDLF